MKDTSAVGSTTEGTILSALLKKGKRILLPFSGSSRYDILLDENGVFVRIQCKTGRIKGSVVIFNNYSVTQAGSKVYTKSEIDFLAIYCPDNDKIYWMPVEICRKGKTRLKLAGQIKKTDLAAKDFEF
jgi:hypothetical protein